MTTLNLLWPRWARVVSRVPYRTVQARGLRCWKVVNLAASLLLDALHRERRARRHVAVVLLGLSLLASPGSAGADDEKEKGSALFRGLGLAMYGAKTGDLLSTELLIERGGIELNPFMQNRGARIAATAAAPILVNWSSEELRKKGHPKLALWMRISVVALFGYATAHNLRAAR